MKYEDTHGWIDFDVRMESAPPQLWMLLGEAQSKVEHIAGVPLQPSVAEHLHKIYLAKGALATTAIEGNTLTEDEAIKVVEGAAHLPPSKEYLQTEIENILRACNRTLQEIRDGTLAPLTPDLVCQYNAEVLRDLELADAETRPGKVRHHSVGVGRYRGAPAEDCPYLLARLCEWLNGPVFRATDEHWGMVYAILKAVIAHLYIAWIHPFGDGNGRTARLLEFRILVSSGFPAPTAHLLSDHYNRTRTEYYRRLDQSSRDGEGGEATFMLYAIRGFVDGLQEQLHVIQGQQLSVMFRDYVHELIGGGNAVNHRRRQLVFALSAANRTVPAETLTSLTPEIAAAYATRTPRTLLRDLATLTSLGLVERKTEGYRAKVETILAFLPLRHRQPATGQ
jgi:Fic family protein